MIKKSELLEYVAESLRLSRRYNSYVKFDVPYITINEEEEKLTLRVTDNGDTKVFELSLKNGTISD